MNSVRFFLISVVFGLCSGCVALTAPPHNAPFTKAESVKALEGCYQNRGEVGSGVTPRYLSAVIWPDAGLSHADITGVRVVATGPGTLQVTAEAPGRVVRASQFVEGKDFRIHDGRIQVKGEPLISFAYPAGNVFIGIGYESRVIGVDTAGAGKLEDAGTILGTAFLVIPIAGHIRDAARFPRGGAFCGATEPVGAGEQ